MLTCIEGGLWAHGLIWVIGWATGWERHGMPGAEEPWPFPCASFSATLLEQLSCKGKEIISQCCGALVFKSGGLRFTLVECSVLARRQEFAGDLVVGSGRTPCV